MRRRSSWILPAALCGLVGMAIVFAAISVDLAGAAAHKHHKHHQKSKKHPYIYGNRTGVDCGARALVVESNTRNHQSGDTHDIKLFEKILVAGVYPQTSTVEIGGTPKSKDVALCYGHWRYAYTHSTGKTYGPWNRFAVGPTGGSTTVHFENSSQRLVFEVFGRFTQK